MVQVLQKVPTFSEQLGQTIGSSVGKGFHDTINARQQEKSQLAEKNKLDLLGKELGIEGLGQYSPDVQKVLISETLKNQGKQNRLGEQQGFLSKIFGQNQGQEQQEISGESGQQGRYSPLQISDADIAQATAMDPSLGRELRYAKDSALKERRHSQDVLERKQETGRKEAFELTKPILAELNQVRKNIPLQEQAIEDIVSAAPNVSALDYFADVTGFEPLRSAEGAKLKTGIKDFFLSDLTRVGARPNQWIEQQLSDALPKIGRSAEANLITAEGLKFKVDLAKKRLEITDDLIEQDRDKFGFVRANIDSRADKEMKKYVVDRQKELKDNIEKIKKEKKGKKDVVRMRSPDGSIYDIDSNDIDEAQENGFEFTEKT